MIYDLIENINIFDYFLFLYLNLLGLNNTINYF